MLKKYTKFLDGLESVEKVFLAVTAAIMVIVIAYQVVLRYVFNASNAWSEELARYLFIYDVFIGSAIALRKNSHLQVDVFLNLMKERTKYIYTIVVTILGILFLAVLFVYSISLCKIDPLFRRHFLPDTGNPFPAGRCAGGFPYGTGGRFPPLRPFL